jgi:hopene-associated glycosyltransferase HpnB
MLALAWLAAVAAAAWAYLVTAHGGYWRTDQRLPAGQSGDHALVPWPGVVAVVPARDEAAMLPATLPALLAQDYPGAFEVVVVDDGSSDGTAAVAAALAEGAATPLRVVAGSRPPEGWAGKVWAMAQGVASAGGIGGASPQASRAGGSEYVLFTDADIASRPGTLTALVAAAEGSDRDLVSQMALLRAETPWERVVVPAFVYFFAQLYPFRRVNKPGGRTAAAAGGCMLVRRKALAAAGGLGRIRGALIDDVALGRLLKRPPARGRCWLGLSGDVASVRPYPRLADLWGMVARSAYTQLRYSPVLLAATVIGLLWIYAVPPAAAIAGLAGLLTGGGAAAGWAAVVGLAGWAIMAGSYLPMLRLYRLSPLRAPGLPLIALMYAGMTLDSARRHYTGQGGAWKGRTTPARQKTP